MLLVREEELDDGLGAAELEDGVPEGVNGEAVAIIGQLLIGEREFRIERLPPGKCEWGPAITLADEVVSSHRDVLLLGGRIVELGCGAGLLSLVCALMGGNVMATDRPTALGPLTRNAAVTGYPQQIWKVVAGKAAGGIVVSKGRGAGQEKEEERLSWGALVEELDKQGDFLNFRRLNGTGPTQGWVRAKQPWGQVVCELTDERPSEVETMKGTLRSCPLVWSREAAEELLKGGKVDLIIASDCVCEASYGAASLPALVETIRTLCNDKTTVLISVQRRLEDGLERFLQLLRRTLFVDKLSSTTFGKAEIILFVARKFSRAEDFHVDLNDGMGHSAPPGSPLKVVRNLRQSQSRTSTRGSAFGEELEAAAAAAEGSGEAPQDEGVDKLEGSPDGSPSHDP